MQKVSDFVFIPSNAAMSFPSYQTNEAETKVKMIEIVHESTVMENQLQDDEAKVTYMQTKIVPQLTNLMINASPDCQLQIMRLLGNISERRDMLNEKKKMQVLKSERMGFLKSELEDCKKRIEIYAINHPDSGLLQSAEKHREMLLTEILKL